MPGRVVVVVGACGGVGTSTFAALLAREARRSGATVLVDLDAHGAGVEVLLGTEGRPGARWADLAGLRGSLDPRDLDGVLPVWRGVEVLGPDRRGAPGGVPPDALAAVWPALRERASTVVVDAPAHALRADVRGVLVGAHAAVVTGQDVRGVAAALAVRRDLLADDDPPVPAQLVLRRRPRARVAPLEAAHVLDLPLLGLLPTDRRLADAVDRGFGPVVARRARLGRAVAAAARACGLGPGGTRG